MHIPHTCKDTPHLGAYHVWREAVMACVTPPPLTNHPVVSDVAQPLVLLQLCVEPLAAEGHSVLMQL